MNFDMNVGHFGERGISTMTLNYKEQQSCGIIHPSITDSRSSPRFKKPGQLVAIKQEYLCVTLRNGVSSFEDVCGATRKTIAQKDI